MLWGKFPVEWCFLTKRSPQVSLFHVPIFGVNNKLILLFNRLILKYGMDIFVEKKHACLCGTHVQYIL
jgi:hypothetical protein